MSPPPRDELLARADAVMEAAEQLVTTLKEQRRQLAGTLEEARGAVSETLGIELSSAEGRRHLNGKLQDLLRRQPRVIDHWIDVAKDELMNAPELRDVIQANYERRNSR